MGLAFVDWKQNTLAIPKIWSNGHLWSSQTENTIHCGWHNFPYFHNPACPITLVSSWKGEDQVALTSPLASAKGITSICQQLSQNCLLFLYMQVITPCFAFRKFITGISNKWSTQFGCTTVANDCRAWGLEGDIDQGWVRIQCRRCIVPCSYKIECYPTCYLHVYCTLIVFTKCAITIKTAQIRCYVF